MVERGGLENRCAFTGTEGSNPSLSATFHVLTLHTSRVRFNQGRQWLIGPSSIHIVVHKMKKVERHLYIRNGRYVYRRRVPEDVAQAFDGRVEVKESLRTDSLQEARRRLHICDLEFEAKLAAARPAWRPKTFSQMPDLPPYQQAFSVEAVERAAREWLAHYISTHSKQTPVGMAPDYGDKSVSAADIIGLLELEIERTLAIDWDSPGAWSQVPLRFKHLADHLAQRAGFDLRLGSEENAQVSAIAFRALKEAVSQQRQALKSKQYQARDTEVFGADRYAQDLQPFARLTVGEARDAYMADPSLPANKKTRAIYEARMGVLVEALGAGTLLKSVTRDTCRRVIHDVLVGYPARPNARLKAMPLAARIEAAQKSGKPTIKAKTLGLYANAMRSLLQWAVDEGHIAANPAVGLRVNKPKTKSKLPFDQAALSAIFHAPIYTGCQNDERGYAKPGPNRPRRHRFWIPLIALFSGMRLNEICQLHRSDLYQANDHWVFRLWADDEVGRTLKNDGSERFVPVHPQLIKIGLIDYLETVPTTSERLFPELKGNPDGSGADPLSKWFTNLLVGLGMKTEKVSFHSFRHNFRDAVREAGIPMDVQRALGGWSDGSASERYGLGHSVATLASGMQKVAYPGLDLSHLESVDSTRVGG